MKTLRSTFLSSKGPPDRDCGTLWILGCTAEKMLPICDLSLRGNFVRVASMASLACRLSRGRGSPSESRSVRFQRQEFQGRARHIATARFRPLRLRAATRPSLAVLRFMTSSNAIGRSTGRSSGLGAAQCFGKLPTADIAFVRADRRRRARLLPRFPPIGRLRPGAA